LAWRSSAKSLPHQPSRRLKNSRACGHRSSLLIGYLSAFYFPVTHAQDDSDRCGVCDLVRRRGRAHRADRMGLLRAGAGRSGHHRAFVDRGRGRRSQRVLQDSFSFVSCRPQSTIPPDPRGKRRRPVNPSNTPVDPQARRRRIFRVAPTMSREFNRYVEKQFALRMKRFDLDPVRASGPIAWPGERCFRTRGEGTVCWLCIFPNYKGLNEFNIELAWSHLGEYPASCTARPDAAGQAAGLFRPARAGLHTPWRVGRSPARQLGG
jgi:hypothetical protein